MLETKKNLKKTWIEKDHLGDWSPEKECCLRLTFQRHVRKPSQSPDSEDGFRTVDNDRMTMTG